MIRMASFPNRAGQSTVMFAGGLFWLSFGVIVPSGR
jgi:hypothetical protein